MTSRLMLCCVAVVLACGNAPEPEGTPFAGSDTCADCHEVETRAWRASHHAQAERELDRILDTAALALQQDALHCASAEDLRGACRWRMPGPDAESQAQPVLRAFGHDPLRQYLVAAEGGRVQVTQAAFDPNAGEWFDVYEDDPRTPGDWGHWTGRGMTWNSRCAYCHNTGVVRGYDAAADHFDTRVAEHGVGCESCHGPAGAHVRQRRAGREDAAPVLEQLRAVAGPRGLEVCASCHTRRAPLTEAFLPGDPYLDHFLPTLPDETDLYYADGQVRDELFVGISFLMSRMHAEDVGCGDCHEPHSGSLRRQGDALCLDCHSDRPGFVLHSRHPSASEGARCVGCHMPITHYMQRDPRRDHGFLIPDPAQSLELGIPNACNRCHTEQTPEWAARQVVDWYGPERSTRTRLARAVTGARRGDPGQAETLLAIARDAPRPVWRAVAIALLPQLPTPETLEALRDFADDEDAWVRLASARALARFAGAGARDALPLLAPLLRDPVRGVRVEAARGLRTSQDPDAPAVADLRAFIELQLDQPGGRAELGTWYLERGQTERALAELEKATQWDPRAPPFHRALAIGQARLGRSSQAIETLERVLALQPRDPMLLFDLALAYAGAERRWEARELLERCVAAEPGFGRAWYNLGLARRDGGDARGAIEALARAHQLEPHGADAPYALALVLHSVGQLDGARAAAEAALAADPQHRAALALARELRGASE